MIRKFNKLFLFVVAIVASFALSSNVFAFSSGEYIGVDHYSRNFLYNAFKGSSNGTFSLYHHWTTYKGTNYTLYCLDAARRSSGSNANLKVSRVLNQNNAKDAVILTILSDESAGFEAKTVAIRAFAPLNKDLSKSQGLGGHFYQGAKANANSGIKWASEYGSYIKDIFGISDTSIKGISKIATLYDSYSSSLVLNESNNTIKQAKALFKKGLEAGAEVAKGKKVNQKSFSHSIPKFTDEYDIIEQDDVRYSLREVTFDITFNKFNDGSKDPVTIAINPDTNGYAKLEKAEYHLGDKEWKEFTSETNFKDLLKDKTVTVYIRTKVKAKAGEKSKFKINYRVDVNYTDEDILTGALVYNTRNVRPATQRFYIYDTEPNKHQPFSKELQWNDIIGVCTNDVPDKKNTDKFKTYMNECCRGRNEAGFSITKECNDLVNKAQTDKEREEALNSKYCKLKAEYCDYCNDKVTVPKNCSEFSEREFEEGLTKNINGPEDIKVCVMDGEDVEGNSYKLTKNLKLDNGSTYSYKDNKYCSVSCKEDYSFALPTGRYTISGRYFTLKMGVVATKSCYTDMINVDLFKQDMTNLTAKLDSFVAAGNLNKNNTEFVNTLNEYNKAIKDIKMCSFDSTNKYSIDPSITFDYQEEYIKMLGSKKLSFVAQKDQNYTETKWTCDGTDIDSTYNTCISGTARDTVVTNKVNGYNCQIDSTGNTYNCSKVDIDIPTTRYAKNIQTIKETYAPESVFYTKYSTGVIVTNPKPGELSKYTLLEQTLASTIDDSKKVDAGAIPVSLKDNQGVYEYNISFSNIGEFFNKEDSYGRLLNIDADGKKTGSVAESDTTPFTGEYVCQYVVNCPECNVSCVDRPELGIVCELDKKPCDGTCDVECVGTCAFDNEAGELYSIHQVSLTNFNPTNRELGANLTNDKGAALINQISSLGQSIYNEPEYSFKFTPAAISYLRNEVNAKSDNGYMNDTMSCKKYSEIVGKSVDYDYNVCTSDVLDELDEKFNVSVHPLADLRDNEHIVSWVDACNKMNSENGTKYNCAIVGTVGPAWK